MVFKGTSHYFEANFDFFVLCYYFFLSLPFFNAFCNYVRLTSGCAEKQLGGSATPVSTLIGPRGGFNQGMVVQQ